jgi:hypothetical protein
VTPEPAPEFRLSSLPRRPALLSISLVLIFTIAAAWFAFHEGTWYDESCSMTSAQGSLGDTLDHANRMERQPPLYFLILNLWLRIHPSIGFARLLSLAATLVGVLLTVRAFVRVSHQESPTTVPLVLAILLASPMTMYLATEARGYALQFALGAALASTLASVHVRGSATRGDVAVILAAGVLLSYINYLAGLAAACATIALLVSRSLSFRQAAVIAAGAVILTLPLLWTVRDHVLTHVEGEPQDPGLSLEGAALVFQRLARIAIPHAVNRGAWQSLLGAIVAVAVAVGLVLRRRSGLQQPLPRPFLVASGLTIALFLAVGLLTGTPLVQERYFSAFLGVLLITSLLLLRASLGWTGAIALLLILATGGAYRVVALHGSGIRKGDWRRIAVKLDQDPTPPLPVYVFPPPEALTLRVEIHDPRRVEAFPRDVDGSRAIGAPDYLEKDEESLRSRVAARVGSQPFWFAYATEPITPPEVRNPLDVVHSFLDRRCTIEGDFPFEGTRLLRLRLRPDRK